MTFRARRITPTSLTVGTRVQVCDWTCTRAKCISWTRALRMARITHVCAWGYQVQFDSGPQDIPHTWRRLSDFVYVQPLGVESVYWVRYWRPPHLALVKAQGWA